MNIEEYSYLWTTKKDEFVLVNTEYGFGIVNKKSKWFFQSQMQTLRRQLFEKCRMRVILYMIIFLMPMRMIKLRDSIRMAGDVIGGK